MSVNPQVMRLYLTHFARLTMLLATLALAVSAFAHRFSDARMSPDLLSYLGAGGTLADICGDTGPAHRAGAPCEACVLAANTLLADPAFAVLLPFNVAIPAIFPPTATLRHTAAPNFEYRARAPPLAMIA